MHVVQALVTTCIVFLPINILIKNLKEMPTLTELIKESLEGKLTDQIRASLETEDNAEKSDDTNSGESKPE